MKKVIFSIFTAAALITAALTINSCTKQESSEQSLNSQQSEHPQMTAEDISVYNRIVNFKKKVDYIKENPGYKSGETMSVDSAKWYLDAAFNLTYSFIFDSFTDFYTDSVFIEVTLTDGEIDLNDLSASYFELYDKLHEVYDSFSGENKDLYSSNIEIVESKSEAVTFKTTATFGDRGTSSGDEQPFIEGDDWMWGEYQGLCPQTDDPEDAATKIADATMEYRYLYIQDEGEDWYAYYTGPTTTVELEQHPPLEIFRADNPLDDYRDYFIFYADEDNLPQGNTLEDFKCIGWEDMNWYYFGIHDIVYSIVPDHTELWPDVEGKTFYDISMMGGQETNTIYPYQTINLFHNSNITYKTRHIIAEANGFPKHY